ncbi:hypothetical protein AB1Y20_020023 [Prymnesium parvum]|uniref:Uncharacterized protein n=1 Tax=Prymnesium parvum TaxID=97485 RepID=A0AB34JWE0_PRYPA
MLALPSQVGRWLVQMGLVHPSEVEAMEPFLLKRPCAQEFENGVRVARLLQMLALDGSETLDTLKDVHTPVAKLYNWNLLLPVMRARGLDVDQDMKVLIVAGDIDLVADLLVQLHNVEEGKPPMHGVARRDFNGLRDADEAVRPSSASAATSVVQFIAFCCAQQLECSWSTAVELARSPKKLRRRMAGGDPTPIVRWYKLVFAKCKALAQLCDAGSAETALSALSAGLSSPDGDVALWSSRVLCRLAADLAGKGLGVSMWQWFSGAEGEGCQGVVDAWNAHPELHSAGALMPLVLHFSGEKLHLFLSTALPRFLADHAAYLGFVLELLPLLRSSPGSSEFMLRSGALTQLLQRAFRVARSQTEAAFARGLALELLARLWSAFPREVESISLEAPPGAAAHEADAAELADGAGVEKGGVSSQVIAELKRGCRDSSLELQLTAHMSLFQLLDEFAAASHPCAPHLFNILAFSLIENHHEPVLRQFLARNMQHSLQEQPYIPVGVLLKPLVKQATLYGYSNTDFDFFLTLAKHQRLGLRHALLLLQFLGKVCLNDALHGRVATIPFLVLVERFHDSNVLHDFLEIFCEQALASLLPETASAKSTAASAIRSTLCIELVAKMLHLPHPHVIARVAPAVRSTAQQYFSLTGAEHPGLNALLAFASKQPEPPSPSAPPPPAKRPPPARASGYSGREPPPPSAAEAKSAAAAEAKAAAAKPEPAAAARRVPKEGGGYAAAAAKGSSPPAPRPKPRPKPAEAPPAAAKAKKPKLEAAAPPAAVAAVPPSADEKELKAQEEALAEQIRALDERLEGERHDKPPAGLSPLDRREHEIEQLKAAREARAERSRLEEERRKLRSARIKRRMRAKYEAKLRAARAAGGEEGGGEAAAAAASRRERPRRDPPPPAELSEAEARRQRGESARREAGKRLGGAELAAIERQLREAEDPADVPIPAGYRVEAREVDGERAVLPDGLQLGTPLEAALEALDGVCFGAVGVHVLQPVAVKTTQLKLVPVGGGRPPKKPPRRAPPAPPPAAAPAEPKPKREPRQPSRSPEPRGRAKPAASRSPEPRPPREAPSRSPPAARSPPRAAEPHAQTERRAPPARAAAGSPVKAAVSLPPLKPKRKQALPEPPASTNPMRAEVQKYQKEMARIKLEEERNEKLQARRAEAKAKLEALRVEKAAKDAEKLRLEAEAEAARQAEEEKKREKERKRQAMLKKKLDEYHREQQKSTQDDDFGNSGSASVAADPARSPGGSTKSPKKESERPRPAPSQDEAAASPANNAPAAAAERAAEPPTAKEAVSSPPAEAAKGAAESTPAAEVPAGAQEGAPAEQEEAE